MRPARILVLLTALSIASGLHGEAAKPPGADVLRAAPLGPVVDAPDGRSEMELVRFDD